jgi:AraC-like DNA-binding protein
VGRVKYESASSTSFEDWDGVHDAVAAAYFPHAMKPLSAGPASSSALDVVDLGPCRLASMAFGATVSVTSDHPGAYAINIPVAGVLGSVIAGTGVESAVGAATVCPPDTPTRIPQWEPSCRLLGFRVERGFLEREYERVLARRPKALPAQLDLRSQDGRDWPSLMQVSFDQVRQSHSQLVTDPRFTNVMASTLITGLLLATTPEEHNDRTGTRPRIVRRIIDAIEEDPARGWTPADMAELAGVTVRRVQQGFREYVGQTPFQYLHDVRLERAHRDLIDAEPGATVTEIAMRWGLTHTGRFAADYRQRYGRSPSETLSR